MNTQNITPEQLTNSVISVPPLARTVEGGISITENRKIVEHLKKGGVRTFLYGGNAVMYHLSSREFKDVLEMMTEFSSDDSLMIPSVGPFYGAMMDQAKILQQYDFPTVMILPTRDMTTSVGIANGIRRFVDYFGIVFLNRAKDTESKMDDQLIPFVIELGKIAVYIVLFFVILSKIFDVDVTALAAGVGIGGIAIAMASKESLENLLGSFTIFFDKPFLVGDLVSTGSITGTVEKVGFRSTRIRTFDKSIVTVPNKNMISAELDNLGKRKVRRARFYIGLTYDTTIDQMKKVVKEIEILINEHPRTDQEGRVKFQEFGASSLDIMVLYYVNSTKWDDFIDVKEDINFKIMEIVKNNDCEFAFPSTTVYLQK